MFSLAIIASCVLVTLTGPSVNCYTISRTQDYSGGYNTGGFIGLKDNQEHLATGNYQQSNTHRYSPVSSGGHSSSISYPESSHSSSYGGHSSPSTPESLNTITSSYQSDSSSDLSQSYSSNPQSIDYPSSSPHSSSGSVSFTGYAGNSGQSSSDIGGIDYSSGQSSPSYSASAPLTSYSGGKASAYTAQANQHNSPYSSGSSVNYAAVGHSSSVPSGGHSSTYPGSYTGTFSTGRHPASIYQADHSQNSYSDSQKFSPASSLKSYLSNLHRDGPPSGNYHAAALTHTPNYVHPPASSATYSKNPGPYFSGGFPKGQKFIIIKDGSGAHAVMHPEANFPSGLFPGGSGYKVRSSGPYSSGHHYQTPSASYNHPVYTSGHPGAGPSSSYFGFS